MSYFCKQVYGEDKQITYVYKPYYITFEQYHLIYTIFLCNFAWYSMQNQKMLKFNVIKCNHKRLDWVLECPQTQSGSALTHLVPCKGELSSQVSELLQVVEPPLLTAPVANFWLLSVPLGAVFLSRGRHQDTTLWTDKNLLINM